MGKKSKDKKKGKGAEKTQAKTEKKLSNKLKKELKALGEDDIENILDQIEKEEKKRSQVVETVVDPPSRRLNFTFIAHPEKDQLILYGGEFFNGQKTLVYNDLFLYNIPNNTWTVVKVPGAPPPRSGHQMIATSVNKGELWLFGGEFVSPSQSQFYHYRDLWLYSLASKKWDKITVPNGPSARSGHRMVYFKKHLFVFGGFHDNLRNCKYFNDIYTFNTETYKWSKLEPSGTPPAPRSACCMVALADGRILVYGGYSKDKVGKDLEKGHVFTDAFLLVPDKNDSTFTKFKWVQTKLGGFHVSQRCSMPVVSTPNCLSAYCYGGVFDVEDDEENLSGIFFDDLLLIDLEKLMWRSVSISGKTDNIRKKKEDDAVSDGHNEEVDMEVQHIEQKAESTTISDDGIFKVTVGPAPSSSSMNEAVKPRESNDLFRPSPRMNCGLAIKYSILYLYGGMFEDGDKQITYSDLYSLDLKKLDEWKVLISDDTAAMECLESDSESSATSDSVSDEESDDEDNSDMET